MKSSIFVALCLFAASSALKVATPVGGTRYPRASTSRELAAYMTAPAEASVEAAHSAMLQATANKANVQWASALTQTVFRRAEFWNNGSTTLLEVINVVGRFDKSADFAVRTRFEVVENVRIENELQGATQERYELAKRNNCCERVALLYNAPELPFKDVALAESLGLTIEDFADIEVTRDAVDIVYDALAESKTSLLPFDACDARRAGFVNQDGSFNELAFRLGLYKGRGLVIFSWFIFGKGNFVWILVIAQFLHDARPDLFPTPKELNLDKIGAFV